MLIPNFLLYFLFNTYKMDQHSHQDWFYLQFPRWASATFPPCLSASFSFLGLSPGSSSAAYTNDESVPWVFVVLFSWHPFLYSLFYPIFLKNLTHEHSFSSQLNAVDSQISILVPTFFVLFLNPPGYFLGILNSWFWNWIH